MIKTLIIIMLLFLASCSSPKQNELVLSTNVWIGYTPLFYAQEKGYLEELKIKLITSVSLAESTNIFLVSKAQLVATTEHEYKLLKKEIDSIVPIILLNRSNGGDMILSNRTIEELQNSEHIDAYLEIDSINKEILEDFSNAYNLNTKQINYINKDQAQIQNIMQNDKKDIIIITYAPNNLKLLKKGFKEISSTSDTEALLVVDALCTSKETLQANKERFQKLKNVIDRSIQEIMQDKKNAHKLTKKYLINISYEEFTELLKTIKWVNNPSKEFLIKLEKTAYEKENLL